MNERILELAKQCGYWSGQTVEMNDVGIEKFAQLIAQHCMNIANKEALAIQELDDGRPTFFAGITTAGRIGRKIGIEFDLFGESE